MALTKEQIFKVADELDAEGVNPTLANIRKRLGSGSFTTISEAMVEWRQEHKGADTPPSREPAPDKLSARLEDFGTEIWNMAVEIALTRLQAEKDEMIAIQSTLELKQQETAEMADQMAVEIETVRQDKTDLESILRVAKENETLLKESLQAEVTKNIELRARLDTSEKWVSDLRSKYDKIREDLNEGDKEQRKLQAELTRMQVLYEKSEAELQQSKKSNEELTKQLSASQVENGKLTGTIDALRGQIAEQNETIKDLNKPSRKGKASAPETKE